MEVPLWTETYAPTLADLPQPEVQAAMERAVQEPVNLVVHGPIGAGKTAAVRAMAATAHEDEAALVELNVADFFDRTKTEIRNDPRFGQFLQGEIPWVRSRGTDRKQQLSKRYKSDWSKAEMVSHVLKEFVATAPAGGDYRTLLLDNAEAAREDFQQALRRVMERHHERTQFVIATRQPSKLIPAIRSRCLSVPVRAPTNDEVVDVLASIAAAEDVAADDEGLEYIAGYADGNLRSAVLAAQTTAVEADELTMSAAYEALSDVGVGDRVGEMLDAAESGSFRDARSILDDLLVDEGLSGQEVLEEVLTVGRARYEGDRSARLHRLAGEVDLDLVTGTSARIHVARLLAVLGAGGDLAVTG
ncbi:MAG: AAA family ATPase [Halobacteriaceae archaeon]